MQQSTRAVFGGAVVKLPFAQGWIASQTESVMCRASATHIRLDEKLRNLAVPYTQACKHSTKT
jgi:hypothetical protein